MKQNFGLQQFKAGQEEAIRALLEGRSGLVVMPTGGGKSLCYQIFSFLKPGLVLVVSPLIALMKDQVDQLRQRGISADYLNSSMSREAKEACLDRLQKGQVKILYVTPERFRKAEFKQALKAVSISLLAIDEAHCVAQWGHDFRPEYSRLGLMRRELGEPLTVALTATATPETEEEIEKVLCVSGFKVKTSIDRPYLAVHIKEVYGDDEKIRGLIGLRHAHQGPAIVYFSLISTLYRFSEALQKLGLEHDIYHGQLPPGLKKKAQEKFLSSDQGLILATPAFGLGIDKPNVRQVIHAELPSSLEAYFQEIGRGGRDGQGALCTLFYDPEDVSIQMEFLKWANPDASFIRNVYRLIEKNPLRVQQEGEDFLRRELNFYNSRDFRVETALNLLRTWDVVEGWQIRAPLDEDLLAEDLRLLRLKRQNEKLLKVVQWIKANEDLACRMAQIYTYFGVQSAQPCGICDLCVKSTAVLRES